MDRAEAPGKAEGSGRAESCPAAQANARVVSENYAREYLWLLNYAVWKALKG